MRLRLIQILIAGLLALPPPPALAQVPHRDVTFICTSDCHYRETDDPRGHHNDMNLSSIEEMNCITNREWPDKLGGGKIAKPRAVLILGDVIDDGDRAQAGRSISAAEYKLFLADFGFSGSDALIKFPVFEGWGNHDGPPAGKEKNGFSFQAQLNKRNQLRKEKGMISNISSNGLHYSWDWDDVHFVQLNIYPANKQREGIHYSAEWHNPQGALEFLKSDLATSVGKSGRPVVLMSHCGFDTDWWVKEDWKEAYDAAKNYNVVLYLYGHSGTGLRKWAPENETNKWDCINDGQTEKGFFVIQIFGNHLRAAMRTMSGLKIWPGPDKKLHHEWGGDWDWKWILDKPVAPGTRT